MSGRKRARGAEADGVTDVLKISFQLRTQGNLKNVSALLDRLQDCRPKDEVSHTRAEER